MKRKEKENFRPVPRGLLPLPPTLLAPQGPSNLSPQALRPRAEAPAPYPQPPRPPKVHYALRNGFFEYRRRLKFLLQQFNSNASFDIVNTVISHKCCLIPLIRYPS